MSEENEYDKIRYLNFMMGRLHDACNALYEHLVDEEVGKIREELKEMKDVLKELMEYTCEITK